MTAPSEACKPHDASAFPSPAASPVADRPPRAAATLVVVREAGEGGFEVLLSRRAERGDHNSGAWVFPGGIVEASDGGAHAACDGLDDAAASARLGLAAGGLDFFVAAVRECFEESGLLFARDASGQWVDLDAVDAGRLGPWRGTLHRGERDMAALCISENIRLAMDRLVYFSHWLTPLGRPKRFDTRFFLAVLPPGQTAAHDGTELVEQQWLRPADALARSQQLKLLTPTLKTLQLLAGFADMAGVMAWALAPRSVALVMPRVAHGAAGFRPVLVHRSGRENVGRPRAGQARGRRAGGALRRRWRTGAR
ncbi:MAG: NUDIX domain-containing protein, partial [Caldimonas sp.]